MKMSPEICEKIEMIEENHSKSGDIESSKSENLQLTKKIKSLLKGIECLGPQQMSISFERTFCSLSCTKPRKRSK